MTDIMSPPRPRTARKVLVASMGVASMTYVISCGGATTTGEDGGPDAKIDTSDESFVGNLAGEGGIADHATIDEQPVGNLGVLDTGLPHDATVKDTLDEFPVANLVVSPDP